MTADLRDFCRGLEDLVSRRSGAVAAIDALTNQTFTYAQLDVLVRRTQAMLAGLGLGPGRILVSMLPNGIEALLVFLAAARMGVFLAPISVLASPREVVAWSKAVRADMILVTDPRPAEVVEALTSEGLPITGIAADGTLPLPSKPAPVRSGAGGGRIYLQTSGTTGTPKVIVIDVDRLWSAACAWVDHHPFLDNDTRFLNYLPVAYLGGLFNLCLIPLAAGGSFVVTETFSGTSLLNFWSDVERFDVNTVWLVPTILRGLLTLHERTSGKHERAYRMIRGAFIGTAILDRETKEKGERAFGFRMLENFALSETTFITSETAAAAGSTRGVGRVLPYVEMRLSPVGAGEGLALGTREILVRSPYLFLGYLRPNGEIDPNRDPEGFFATGDLGRMGEDGETLLLEGRIRDIVKKGGYLISLNEVETVAAQHPAVVEASAVGVPHEFYGEDVALFVRFREDAGEDTVGSLRIWLSENLAKFKWPTRITAVEALPRTASGKVEKFKLAGS
jgi:acyl-CoA synthetase (AMP-forming)/AMP-acid ligase II